MPRDLGYAGTDDDKIVYVLNVGDNGGSTGLNKVGPRFSPSPQSRVEVDEITLDEPVLKLGDRFDIFPEEVPKGLEIRVHFRIGKSCAIIPPGCDVRNFVHVFLFE